MKNIVNTIILIFVFSKISAQINLEKINPQIFLNLFKNSFSYLPLNHSDSIINYSYQDTLLLISKKYIPLNKLNTLNELSFLDTRCKFKLNSKFLGLFYTANWECAHGCVGIFATWSIKGDSIVDKIYIYDNTTHDYMDSEFLENNFIVVHHFKNVYMNNTYEQYKPNLIVSYFKYIYQIQVDGIIKLISTEKKKYLTSTKISISDKTRGPLKIIKEIK